MASLSYDKLVSLLKKKDLGHSAAASELGLTTGQISSMAFQQALVDSGRLKTQPRATNAQIRKMKDSGDRWERIAAVTGKSVADIKAAYEDAGGDLDAIVRTRSGNGTSSGSASKSGAKSKAKSAGKSKSKTSASKAKSSSARPARRARTLAERRAARASNPS